MLSTKIRLLILSFLIAASTVFINGCSQSDETTIILAHGMHNSHPVSKAMIFMADRLREKSEGQLDIKIYPNQQLGSEQIGRAHV